MGTLNIVDWCKENGNPKPEWEVQTDSVIITFRPSRFFTTGKTFEKRTIPPSRPESRPESLEHEILRLLRNGPLSKSEIVHNLGHAQISGGLKKVLFNLTKNKKIAFTVPEKPNSRLQKYKLTHVDVDKSY